MNAQDIIKYGHLTVLGAIEDLPDAEWNIGGACGFWSIKDIIAHLASFELVLADVLAGMLGAADTPMLKVFQETGNDFNDEQVELRKGKSAAEALAEYNEAHERVRTLAAQVPADKLRAPGTIPWYGREYALDDYIVYAFYGHKREHCAQIAAFRDR
jgi:uncharacterized damage-inducible protein DinB